MAFTSRNISADALAVGVANLYSANDRIVGARATSHGLDALAAEDRRGAQPPSAEELSVDSAFNADTRHFFARHTLSSVVLPRYSRSLTCPEGWIGEQLRSTATGFWSRRSATSSSLQRWFNAC